MRNLSVTVALGIVFLASLAVAQSGTDRRRSGYHDMAPALRKMQDDDSVNPAMSYVKAGEALWHTKVGAANKACADCHDPESMKGVATRYPAIAPGAGKPVDLEGRINLCRTEHQKAFPLAAEGRELLALAAYVARQSRGTAIAPPDDPRLASFRARGEQLFKTRQGQLNLSCANCHDDNAGKTLGGATIPQGHPTGYPVYRPQWQALGSLKRRLRNCMIGMRADPYDHDAPEYLDLEVYLMDRAKGMTVDAPAVRP